MKQLLCQFSRQLKSGLMHNIVVYCNDVQKSMIASTCKQFREQFHIYVSPEVKGIVKMIEDGKDIRHLLKTNGAMIMNILQKRYNEFLMRPFNLILARYGIYYDLLPETEKRWKERSTDLPFTICKILAKNGINNPIKFLYSWDYVEPFWKNRELRLLSCCNEHAIIKKLKESAYRYNDVHTPPFIRSYEGYIAFRNIVVTKDDTFEHDKEMAYESKMFLEKYPDMYTYMRVVESKQHQSYNRDSKERIMIEKVFAGRSKEWPEYQN